MGEHCRLELGRARLGMREGVRSVQGRSLVLHSMSRVDLEALDSSRPLALPQGDLCRVGLHCGSGSGGMEDLEILDMGLVTVPKCGRKSADSNEDKSLVASLDDFALTLICIFDGHASKSVSSWLEANFEAIVREVLSVAKAGDSTGEFSSFEGLFPVDGDVFHMLKSRWDQCKFDSSLAGWLAVALSLAEERAAQDPEVDTFSAGSTVSVVGIDRMKGEVVGLALGDSKISLVHPASGKILSSAPHHVKERPDEEQRVRSEGGAIHGSHIGCQIAALGVTRAFGDNTWQKSSGIFMRDSAYSQESSKGIIKLTHDTWKMVGLSSVPEWYAFSKGGISAESLSWRTSVPAECQYLCSQLNETLSKPRGQAEEEDSAGKPEEVWLIVGSDGFWDSSVAVRDFLLSHLLGRMPEKDLIALERTAVATVSGEVKREADELDSDSHKAGVPALSAQEALEAALLKLEQHEPSDDLTVVLCKLKMPAV